MSLHYQLFHKNKPIISHYKFTINSGDLYIMSEKEVGYDLKKSSQITLRHSAGSNKYTNLKKYIINKDTKL